MDHFAGLDVSVKETSVCIVDETGSAEAGSLDSGDMYKHIFSAGLRLNKAVPFWELNHFTVPVAIFNLRFGTFRGALTCSALDRHLVAVGPLIYIKAV